MQQGKIIGVKPRVSRISEFHSFLLFVNVGIGAYISVTPSSWYYQGLIIGLLSLIFGTLLIIQGASAYVQLSNEFKAYNAQDLAKIVLGDTWFGAMIAIQMLGAVGFSIATIYLSATTLMGIFQRIVSYDTLSPTWFQALCVLSICIILLPFVLKREVKGLHSAALILFVSLILLTGLCIYYYFSYYHYVRKNNPDVRFRVPLWPEYQASRTIGRFLVLAYSQTCLQTALIILYSRKTLDYKSGMRPIMLTELFLFIVYVGVSLPLMYLFGEDIISGRTFLDVISTKSTDVTSLLIQLVYIFTAMFHAPGFLFSARESTLLFFAHNFKSVRRTDQASERYSDIEESSALIQEKRHSPIMYERVKKPAFYLITLGYFSVIVLVTMFLKNIAAYFELVTNPWIIFTNTVFPNICLIAWKGAKQEKVAVLAMLIGAVSSVLSFFFAVYNLASS